jgi:cyclic-di-GMP-binding protein
VAKTLELQLPERGKPGKEAFDLRPRHVETWLNELPRGNIGETARQMFLALVDTNRLDYPHQNRIQFLEAARETVAYTTDAMRRHFISVNAPMPEKNWKIAEATREIYCAQGTGYLIAIEDLLKHSFLFADSHTLAVLVHRAFSAFGRAMLTCYQSYTPLPEQLWTRLHHLYSLAEERNILNTSITDPQHRFVPKTSVVMEYTRLLLLGLASPYRLRHGEVTKVYDILERWNSKCRLQATSDEIKHGKNGMSFGVNLASDESARALTLSREDCNPADYRVLDTQPLANSIRKEVKHGFKGGETTLTGIEMNRPDLSHDLMRRLLIAWCAIPRRGFPRSEIEERVEVTLGLSATHQVIITGSRRRATDDNTFTNTAQFEAGKSADGINMSGNTPAILPDVWDMFYISGSVEGIEVLEEQFQKEQQPIQPRPSQTLYHPETWAILNESARGYCIQSVGRPKEARAQVGELVGIRRSIGGQTWKWGIGVIRWLKADDHNRLVLGIEMLTPDAAAIGIRGMSNTKNDYKRTLMLPEIKAINQPTTLITSAVPYRVSNQLIINILGKEIMIRLTKQVQNTGLFAQFEFEILEQQQQPGTKTDKQDETDSEFESVWTSI